MNMMSAARTADRMTGRRKHCAGHYVFNAEPRTLGRRRTLGYLCHGTEAATGAGVTDVHPGRSISSAILGSHPMKSVATLALALALTGLLACRPPGPGAPHTPPAAALAPSAITLSIVGTSDLHGGIAPQGGRGGLALLGGYVRNLRAARARDGGAVLLLDAGDMFQGTLASNLGEGAVVVEAYNVLGYTAAAIGNHELDFGPIGPAPIPRAATDDPRGALKARAAEASFPLLAANLIDEATGQPVDWPNVKPSAVVEVAGIRVGIVGAITRGALSATIAPNTVGLRVAPLAATIEAHATRLRAEGAAVVVVTAHAGGRCTRFDRPEDLSSCQPTSEIIDVARQLPRGLVNAIVAGHTHAAMAHEVNGIPIVQSFSRGRAFGRVDLAVDRQSGSVTRSAIFAPRDLCASEDPATHTCAPEAEGRRLVPARYEGLPVAPDPATAAVVARALERVDTLEATPVGVRLERPIVRGNDPESPLGNLFTDAFRESVPGADLAINNTFGGIRADLPPGSLTYGSVYKAFPFDNRLVTLRLSGREVRRMFATVIHEDGRPPGISGLRVRARCTAAGLDVSLLRPTGMAVQDDESLVVVTTDFLALGEIFRPIRPPQGFVLEGEAPLARDVVVEWLKRRGGRLTAGALVDTANPRWLTPETQSIDCPAD